MSKKKVGTPASPPEYFVPCPKCDYALFWLAKEKKVIKVPGKEPCEETIVKIVCANCNHQISEIIGGIE